MARAKTHSHSKRAGDWLTETIHVAESCGHTHGDIGPCYHAGQLVVAWSRRHLYRYAVLAMYAQERAWMTYDLRALLYDHPGKHTANSNALHMIHALHCVQRVHINGAGGKDATHQSDQQARSHRTK